MSDDEPTTASAVTTANSFDYSEKIQSAIQSLSFIISPLPPSVSSSSTNPALTLLHDPDVSFHITTLLRSPSSGSGDNNLCRWLYDTFQSAVPDLQLLVLRFLPIIAGVYLSRVALRKPQVGFEAVLLALYAHETTSRAGQAVTITTPDLSQSSIYHESKIQAPTKNNSTGLNVAVISPSLEPHGTMRSTRRARIVGVALELYYNKISQMPIDSKIDFCEFCKVWAGQDGEMYKEEGAKSEASRLGHVGGGNDGRLVTEEQKNAKKKEGRIGLPWELLQPVLRILGHCLMGGTNKEKEKELFGVASEACRSLYARSVHDINSKAILATGSLLRLSKMMLEKVDDCDPTELPRTNVISL